MTESSHVPGAPLRVVQGPVMAFLMERAINPLMRRVLASRFHRVMGSDTLMILSFHGRKSGTRYTFPIGYMQDGGSVVSYTPFRWWTNLRGDAPVTVTLRGQRLTGTADVTTDPATVAAGMAVYLRHNPGDARFWGVKLDADKVPDPADIERVAPANAQVRIVLAEGS